MPSRLAAYNDFQLFVRFESLAATTSACTSETAGKRVA